jgi:hypothetical protein
VRLPARSLACLAFAGALVLTACGSDAKPGASSVTEPPVVTAPDGHVVKPASSEPSVSAKMVCEPEVVEDLEGLFGLQPTAPVKPTWEDSLYSCTFEYPGGDLTLSVKELADESATDDYFASLAKRLGKTQDINGIGDGAFTTADKSAVVRKDYKVLLVDISKLPPQFGDPPASTPDIALNVAAAIMGCWTGA